MQGKEDREKGASKVLTTTQSAWPTGMSLVPAGIRILAKTLQ